MSRGIRLIIFSLVPILLFGGCAAAKVAVQPPAKPALGSGLPPVTPAPASAPSAASTSTPQALPSSSSAPATLKVLQPPTEAAACDEQQPLVRVERYLKLPAVSEVDHRMSVYGDKLSRWKTLEEQTIDHGLVARRSPRWSECFTAVEKLFEGYSQLMEEDLRHDEPMVKEEELSIDPWQLYYEDIAYLEGGCDQVYQDTSALVTGSESRQTAVQAQENEAIVGQYFAKGLFDEAVQVFEKLQEANPSRDFKVETRKMYGLALLKTGQMDKAVRELSKVLEAMSPSPARRSLRRQVADLLLASGKMDQAYADYRQLADYYESGKGDDRWVADQLALLGLQNLKSAPELPFYLEVLQDYITFNGRKIPDDMQTKVEKLEELYPASPLTARARDMLGQLGDSSREWLKSEMDRVDQYLAAHDFDRAKSVLELLLVDDLDPSVLEQVQHTMDNVVQTEQQYLAEQMQVEAREQAQEWDSALAMLDSGKYDQAISEFTSLFNTVYDAPARAKIKVAMETAAVQMRRQAANLVIRARRAEGVDEKKKFLEESWALLNKIITSYPQVTIIDKVRQNQAMIEQQIAQLDPQLLRDLKGEGNQTDSGPGTARPIPPSNDFH